MNKALNVFELPLNGKFLIEAGAGTGKTYNITSLYLRVLVEKLLMPNQVLVLTFTNDATNELKKRLRSRIQEVINTFYGTDSEDEFVVTFASKLSQAQADHLQQCLYAFDEAAVSTIHGFCQRILSEYSIEFEVSPNFDLLTDELPLLTEVTDSFWVDYFYKSEIGSEFERWSNKYLEAAFKSPEDFLDAYRELCLNPDLDVSRYDRSLDDYRELYIKASEALIALKNQLEVDKEALAEIIATSPLSGRYYRNKEDMFSELVTLVQNTQTPGLIFSGYDTKADTLEGWFQKFGRFMHENGAKKGGSIPFLQVFDRVDDFYELNNDLLSIKNAFVGHAIRVIREKYANLKKRRNQIGYNDLLVKFRDVLLQNSSLATSLKHRFPAAFIDEFQDTDHIQYAIFEELYEGDESIFWVMIGDPKQAIYRFRGADINTYLYAKKQVSTENTRTLLHNYRSSKSLIQGINAFFNHSETPFGLQDLHFEDAVYPVGRNSDSEYMLGNKVVPPISVVSFKQENERVGELKNLVMESVCTEILRLLDEPYQIDEKPVSTEDIAILVDKHQHAAELQQKLAARGLKSIIRSKASVFETQESDDLYRILVAVAEFTNQNYIRAAMLTRLLRLSASEVQRIFDSEEETISILQRFSDLNEIWQKEGFSRFINRLFVEFDLEVNAVKTESSERVITNLLHLKELLVDEYRSHGKGISGMLRFLQEKRERPNADNDSEIIRLESDGKLIQIVTHHASKGLEYPIVFCPFLWDLNKSKPPFIVQSNGKSTTAILKTDSAKYDEALPFFELEEISEQKRLAYVALTRAKTKCFVYLPTNKKVKNATGRNIIGTLWEENVEPQLSDISELEIKDLNIDSKHLSLKNNSKSVQSKFKRSHRSDLWEYPRMVSYSSLVESSGKEAAKDFLFKDIDDDENLTVATEEKEGNDIFALPKGKNTGNIVHAIFENIEFDNPDRHTEVIREMMTLFNIEKKWERVLIELVQRSLQATLIDQIQLNQLPKQDTLVEMEFYIPVQELSKTKLLMQLGKEEEEDLQSINGYLKGFIDLIFRVENTYYILDYKTNHLGNRFEDYSKSALAKEMKSAKYDVQYHLYTLALYRYLQTRIPHFDYSKHFGGVFYLFVRGINPQEKYSGVFFDKPKESLIEALNAIVSKVEDKK
jgi:exodeoxyribonuclease V beta subunit